MEHQGLRDHIPCILVRRTNGIRKMCTDFRKPRHTVYKLLLTTPPRILRLISYPDLTLFSFFLGRGRSGYEIRLRLRVDRAE